MGGEAQSDTCNDQIDVVVKCLKSCDISNKKDGREDHLIYFRASTAIRLREMKRLKTMKWPVYFRQSQ